MLQTSHRPILHSYVQANIPKVSNTCAAKLRVRFSASPLQYEENQTFVAPGDFQLCYLFVLPQSRIYS